MNTETFREFCLSLPFVSEDMPFDDTNVVYRIRGKIFANIPTDQPNVVVLKCAPDIATELRMRYNSIQGAWHWNKKYWNSILLDGSVPDSLVEKLTEHAYDEVNKKLPKYIRIDKPAIDVRTPFGLLDRGAVRS